MSRKKIGAVVLFLVAIALVATLVLHQGRDANYGGDFYEDGDSKDAKTVKLWVGTQRMQDMLAEENLYPTYYKIAKNYEIAGASQAEAQEKAETTIVEQEAKLWYAKKQGVAVNDKELLARVDLLIRELKKSKDYAKLDALYQAEDTTFEEAYRKNHRWNRYEATMHKCSTTHQPKTSKIVSDFRGTKQYDGLAKALKICHTIFKEYGSNGAESPDIEKCEL